MGVSTGAIVDRPKPIPPGRSALQQFDVGAFHQWYNFVLGYSDQLVSRVFREFEIPPGSLVLDPFCGSGTTLVEAARRGVASIGIDANPFAAFAARVKTRFSVNSDALFGASERSIERYAELFEQRSFENDSTYQYVTDSGMVNRGWISPTPLRRALALKHAILARRDPDVRDVLMLALAAELPSNIGNMKFGPQIYRGPAKKDVDPVPLFRERVARMVDDLRFSVDANFVVPTVLTGDARSLKPALRTAFGDAVPEIDFVICSPPYPTEHDYTRHTRLELAFTDDVTTLASLRAIKRSMIRSHTKGIYKGDEDADRVAKIASVEAVAMRVEEAVIGKESGFEKLYPTVVRAYFGGMRRHFGSLYRLMRPGARAAYVVGDQAAYARVPIQTAQLLGEVAESVGFRVDNISHWRQRWASGMSSYLDENILYLSKPARR